MDNASKNPWRPDPKDDRTPIAPPDTVSVQRPGLWKASQARIRVSFVTELLKHCAHDFWRAFAQGALRDVARRLEHLFDLFMFFIHSRIVGRLGRAGYSYLPSP